MLNPKEVKQKYPKTYKSIIDWLSKCSDEGNVITEEMVQAFLYGNPRFLYDYFDDMGYQIRLDDESVEYHGRKSVEEAEFELALKTMEEKL